jgi:hypothetical protein
VIGGADVEDPSSSVTFLILSKVIEHFLFFDVDMAACFGH